MSVCLSVRAGIGLGRTGWKVWTVVRWLVQGWARWVWLTRGRGSGCVLGLRSGVWAYDASCTEHGAARGFIVDPIPALPQMSPPELDGRQDEPIIWSVLDAMRPAEKVGMRA